jgi:cytochrome P450
LARRVLGSMRVLERYPDLDGKLATRYELDSHKYIAALLGKLTGLYFGVEDPIDYKLATWSREMSLHVFRECPTAQTRALALASGADFRRYVAELVRLLRDKELGDTPFNDRLRAVVSAFDALHDDEGKRAFDPGAPSLEPGGGGHDEELVSTLLGIVSGALATTASLFSQALSAYAKQQPKQAFELPATDSGPALLQAIKDKGLSVPERIYRLCRNDTTLGGVPVAAGTLVVVGQGSALAENQGGPDDITFFGHGQHRCPAARLALAIIDGAALALSEQGPLTMVDADAVRFSISLTAR